MTSTLHLCSTRSGHFAPSACRIFRTKNTPPHSQAPLICDALVWDDAGALCAAYAAATAQRRTVLCSSRVGPCFLSRQSFAPAAQVPGLQLMPGYQQYDMPAYQEHMQSKQPPMPGYQVYDQPGYEAYALQHSVMPPQVSRLPAPVLLSLRLCIRTGSRRGPHLCVGTPVSVTGSVVLVGCCRIGSECAVAVSVRTGMLGKKS